MKKALTLIALVAAACGGRGTADQVTLSARLGPNDGAALRTSNGAAQVASGIELSRVRIAVRRLRVERKDAGTEVKLSEGPLLLDASREALSGALVQLVTSSVPAGTYDKLKIDIHRAVAPAPAAFDDLVQHGASVLLEGTIDGQPFTFASGLEAELEHESEFQLGAGTNITLNIDPSLWFQADDGSRLDPRDSSRAAQIEANIRRSFSAFEDDDEDGADDHGHHDGGGDRGRRDGGDDDGGHHDGGVDDGNHGGNQDAGVDDGPHDAGDDRGVDAGAPDAGDDHGGGDDRGGGGNSGPGGGGSDDGSGHH